jgi:outer membrane protein assembly factor BamB/tetratricopeptide (TPR) repeat protein
MHTLDGKICYLTGALAVVLASTTSGADAAGQDNTEGAAGKDALLSIYSDYTPDFVDLLRRLGPNGGPLSDYMVDEKAMKLSAESSFYTLSRLTESDRANALVGAGIEKEKQGRYREATDVYRKILDEYPDMVFRVSPYGAFVPVATYCQLRLLRFPPEELALYRVREDPRARDAFLFADQRNSLEGLAQIRDTMMATSFGAPALMTLGYSALDQGHFLEALEYFETVWESFPEQRTKSPALSMSMTLCRRRLGYEDSGDEQYGLVGHWKFDEGKGDRTADLSGFGNTGMIRGSAEWVPGKTGSALHFSWNNAVSVPASTFLNTGVGGAGFSVSLWVKMDRPDPHRDHAMFGQYGENASEYFALQAAGGKGEIGFAMATANPEWETGLTPKGVTLNEWTHVGLVRTPDQEVRIYLGGKLALVRKLKAPALKNSGGIAIGRHMHGALDEVRLYDRALLEREVAALAGAVGKAAFSTSLTGGTAPLAVDFAPLGEALPETAYFWEFGDGQSARGSKARHTYELGGNYSVTLTVIGPDGSISACTNGVAVKWRGEDEDFVGRMGGVIERTVPETRRETVQPVSGENISADDHAPMPPSLDPMALKAPVWREDLAGARNDQVVYTQPVVTKRAVIYRHKNTVFCRSILNGELLWANDLGGRITWQDRNQRQYPIDGLVVQDGLVFTVMLKVGPSLVALDEVTGQLKWAYGPVAASTPEEAQIRFEATPAAGPGAIFAGYILDNIQGNAHTDTEYGLMAFESTTGRVLWRREICRLQPGLFAGGFAVAYRNRIRSFASPPLYHEGTVYFCTDAGAVAAVDALSGQVKWLIRYPYWPAVHDATLPFGSLPGWSGTVFTDGMHEPSFWFNQRPWVVGDRLFVLPVDSTMMHCLERKTGKVEWSLIKRGGSYTHVLGPTRQGYLVLATSGRGGIVQLLDPKNGRTVWTSPDPILPEDHPVMVYNHDPYGSAVPGGFNNRGFYLAARPFLTTDDRLYTSYFIDCGFNFSPWCVNMAEFSLKDRELLNRRRYYVPAYLAFVGDCINRAKANLKQLEDLPLKDARVQDQIKGVRAIAGDTVPENTCGPFLPASRVTFERFGVPFELRTGVRNMEMLYDREAVRTALAGRPDAEALFAGAELAFGESRLKDTAALMRQALDNVSTEDLLFRAVINQQLHLVYKRLAQSSVRAGLKDGELANCMGMSRTILSLRDEIESMLALSEAYERNGNITAAATLVRRLIGTYRQYEYALPSLLVGDRDALARLSDAILSRTGNFAETSLYGREIARPTALAQGSLGLYFSALSPLRRDLKLRAGELGARRLLALRAISPELTREMDREAEATLSRLPPDEQLAKLWEFAGTPAAQDTVNRLLASTGAALNRPDIPLEEAARLRRRGWMLADAARTGGLTLPRDFATGLLAPAEPPAARPLKGPFDDRELSLKDERSPAWLVLDRHGQSDVRPEYAFIAGRVQKRVDNKFLLYCLDTGAGRIVWKAREKRGEQWFEEIRLGQKGDEPGFFEAFVFGDTVVTCGMYEVLAFDLADGSLRWRYSAPLGFIIRHATMSGDILIVTGDSETLALCLATKDPRGEVIWQENEDGMPYVPSYLAGDRLVEVRKMPANLTVRYRSTGKLMGQLALPDLSLFDEHPLVDGGPRAVPLAHHGSRLAVTDGAYYYMVDVVNMRVMWKRLIDQNDPTRPPPMRMAMEDTHLAVLKQDYDRKALYMLSATTGEILWNTDPAVADSPQPLYSMMIRDGRLYGIRPHPGQSFHFACVDCRTGKDLFRMNEQKGYGGKPEVSIIGNLYGKGVAALIRDRQDFEIKAFDAEGGALLHTLKVKSSGNFGEHGCASAGVNNGGLILLGGTDLKWTAEK